MQSSARLCDAIVNSKYYWGVAEFSSHQKLTEPSTFAYSRLSSTEAPEAPISIILYQLNFVPPALNLRCQCQTPEYRATILRLVWFT